MNHSALLVITTILWAFSFSLIGEYFAGHVDSGFSVLMRIGLAALVFLPFLRWRYIFSVLLAVLSAAIIRYHQLSEHFWWGLLLV